MVLLTNLLTRMQYNEKCRGKQETIYLFQRLTASLYSMLSVILARTTNHEHIKKTDRYIQLFLSNLDNFQKKTDVSTSRVN